MKTTLVPKNNSNKESERESDCDNNSNNNNELLQLEDADVPVQHQRQPQREVHRREQSIGELCRITLPEQQQGQSTWIVDVTQEQQQHREQQRIKQIASPGGATMAANYSASKTMDYASFSSGLWHLLRRDALECSQA